MQGGSIYPKPGGSITRNRAIDRTGRPNTASKTRNGAATRAAIQIIGSVRAFAPMNEGCSVPCFRQLLKGELTVSLAGFLRTSSALCLTIGPSLLRPIIESPATGALLPQHANNRHPPPQRERFSQSIISFLSSFPSRNVRVPARCARILDFQPSWVPALQ